MPPHGADRPETIVTTGGRSFQDGVCRWAVWIVQ